MAPTTKEAKPLSPHSQSGGFPPDVVRLLDVLVRIERRRQAKLRAMRIQEAS
jgi:hypothetical protein